MTRNDRADDVSEVLSGVAEALTLRAVRALAKLAPLFFVEHEAASDAG